MERISWNRFKGKLPPNTSKVDRTTRYGNPYKLSEYPRAESLRLYSLWLDKELKNNPDLLQPLVGKKLACSCKLSEPCHADILLNKLKELYK